MRFLCTYILLVFSCAASVAQDNLVRADSISPTWADTLAAEVDSLISSEGIRVKAEDGLLELTDTVGGEQHVLSADSILLPPPVEIGTKRWIPDPKKAMWLAIVFPGGGQIYNRKYWKLPLIYGGFIGCIYALSWNGSMYRDYSQAYIDIMDNDPNTKSYENFLPASYDVEARKEYLQNLFKRKKNYFRRYRDLSLFCMIGVYLLSIVDAYVDAELSSFDITKDLTMKVSPAVINDYRRGAKGSGMNGSSYGLQCRLNF